MHSQFEDEFRDRLLPIRPPLLGKPQILLTAHAQRQMKVRGITIRQVIQVIRTPHEFHDADMGRVRARRIRAGGKSAIDVEYELESDMVIIVTAITKQWKK